MIEEKVNRRAIFSAAHFDMPEVTFTIVTCVANMELYGRLFAFWESCSTAVEPLVDHAHKAWSPSSRQMCSDRSLS
jgi:hypothetical protein